MKLLKVLSVAVLGTLLAVGCTVTTTDSTDSGPVTDSGAKVDGDVGPAACAAPKTTCGTACVNTQTDTANCGACGTACKTGESCTAGKCATGGGGMTCEECQKAKCAAEASACADPANTKGCNDLITCINACTDATCANKCVSDSTSTAGKAYLQCVIDNCATECGG